MAERKRARRGSVQRFHTTLDPKTVELLDTLCERAGLSRPAVLTLLIREAHNRGEPPFTPQPAEDKP